MERYLRVAAVAGGAAFLVSGLTGLVAAVGIGTVLVRALVAFAVFGAGAVGVFIAAEKNLPGLVEANGGGSDKEAGESDDATRTSAPTGGRLNIVVEEDGTADTALESDQEVPVEEDEDGLVEEVAEAALDEDEDEIASLEDADDEAPETVHGPDGGTDGGHDTDAGDRDTDAGEDGNMDAPDDVDEMPDIGGFAGSFVSSQTGESDDDGSIGATDGRSGGESRGDSGNDPAQIAKALRTMMERDG